MIATQVTTAAFLAHHADHAKFGGNASHARVTAKTGANREVKSNIGILRRHL